MVYTIKSYTKQYICSGNFDLKNIKNTFYEVSECRKISQDDVNFIEKEFNDFMLDDGYKNYSFPQFKNFVKSILSE